MTSRYTPQYRITPAILHCTEEIGEALGNLRAYADSATVPALRRGNRIKTIQASLGIEGNTLTLDQVTAVLDGKRVLGQPREIQEVRNAFAAYEELANWAADSRSDILAAHGVLMAGLADEAGRLRSGNVGIHRGTEVVHVAPPPAQVPGLIDDLLAWLKETEEHPLVASCVFHYMFEFIHPFQDGNGRLGRLWQTLILGQWRPVFAMLPVESIIRDHQQEYYAALAASDQDVNATPFTEVMLNAILQAIQESDLGSDQVTDQQSDQVTRLLRALGRSPRSASDLMNELGLTHRPTFRKNYLHPALAAELIEMVHPDTPRSRSQKYRLTERGRRLLDAGNA
jgi:Fic family protein